MTTILRVDASTRGANSVSRALGDHFVNTWLSRDPHDRVLRRDVAAAPIAHIADQTIAGFYAPADRITDDLRAATALSDLLIEEIRTADVLLLTVPMHNFSVPSALKAWIDHVVRIGHTFAYDGTDFTGLVTGRSAYVVCAYGSGGYLDSGPLASADFVTPYLAFVLNFLGVSEIRYFAVEGTQGDQSDLAATIKQVKLEIEDAVAAATTAAACAA